MPATAHHNRVGDFYSNPLISLMNSFDISSQLPTTITTTIVVDVTCLQNLLHRLKKKENERACERASELKDAQPPLPSTLLTYSSIFRLFVQHLQEVFFSPCSLLFTTKREHCNDD